TFASAPFRISSGNAGGAVAQFNDRGEYDIIYYTGYGASIYHRSLKQDGTFSSAETKIAAPNTGIYDAAYSPSSKSFFVASNSQSADSGNTVYEIKSDWTVGQPADVAEDITRANYVPAVTVMNGVPLVLMNRIGAAYVQFGPLNYAGGGSVPAGAKIRQCNSQFTVNVTGDCQLQGTCAVSVFAKDMDGNVGQPYSRTFAMKTLFTNITSPPENSWQSANFSVSVADRSFASGAIACTYDVYSIGASAVKTADNRQRQCNGNFTVSVGANGTCRNIGQGACRVVSKVNATINGTVVQDASERFYNVDWITPVSEISSAPTGWVSGDFTISAVDGPAGANITECQYRVLSNGTETRRWSERTCGTGSLATVAITAGTNGDCRHEGGEACLVQVRALGRGRTPGFGDNASIAVIFSDIDANGFHLPLGAVTTGRGINFSGTTRTELRAATFYVCSSRSTPAGCIAAYSNASRGISSNNYCGSVTGRCELRCSDTAVSYYFAARGVPIGTFEQLTVLSPVRIAQCPVFNMAEINRLLGIFRQLDQDISIQIMEIDTFIRQNGETDTANNDTLDVLNEALLLTRDHLNYMNATMSDLTAAKAQELITRSNAALDEINRLLRGLVQPVSVRLAVNMPETIRFNRSTLLLFTITKTGPRPAYANVYCSITAPNGTTTRGGTRDGGASCMAFDESNSSTSLSLPFFAGRIGQYQYSCTLGRSARSGCLFEVNQTPVTGAFRALPGFGTYINSVSGPATVLRGRSAAVTVGVNNPDDTEKFASVRCDFTDPLAAVRRNTSACTRIDAGGSASAQVSMIADRVGNWTVSRCQVSASEFSGCAGIVLDNVSRQSANYTVAIPDDVFIESVTLPAAPIVNGSLASISMSVTNPASSVSYVNATCTLAPPYGTVTIWSTAGMEPGATRAFLMNMTTDATGTWNVSSCTTYKSSSPTFAGQSATSTVHNPGYFTVNARTTLFISSINVPQLAGNRTSATVTVAVSNPSVARYGLTSCVFRSPANAQYTNSSQCILVDNSASLLVKIYLNREGIWNVESCSVFGSVNPDCASASLHDRRLQAGAINSTAGAAGFCGDGVIDAGEQCDNGANNGACPATCSTSCAINNCDGCTPGLYHANNATTGACAEFNSNCVPAGWVNRTAGPCPGTNNPYINSVSVPSANVTNNSNVNVVATVTNPLNDDRFALVSCFVRNPSGSSTLLTSTCTGIQAGSSRNYAMTIFADKVGAWNVTSCSVNASISCASAARTHTFNASRTFSVVPGLNLSFASIAPPSNVLVNTSAAVSVVVRNPSEAARFARVTCNFRKPSNQVVQNSTGCTQVGGGGTLTQFDVSMAANAVGTWSVTDCSLRGGLSDCSAVHDSESNIGAFNVTATCTPGLYSGFNATSGACVEFGDSCVPAGYVNVSQQACPSGGGFVRISSVAVPSADVINNSNININVLAANPLDDDRFALVSCSLRSPFGTSRLLSSSCQGIESNSARTYNLPVFVDITGRWNVTTCSINASANCASAALTHSLNASKTFNVIRGINMTFVSFTLPADSPVNSSVQLLATVRNPSDAARYARVTCSFRTPSNQITSNSTACTQIAGTSAPSLIVRMHAREAGAWSAEQCSLRASLTSDCSDLHDTESGIGIFNITSTAPPPPAPLFGLYISNISAPATAVNNSLINVAVLAINPNPANSSYALTGCLFTSPSGSVSMRASGCLQVTANSTQQFMVSNLANIHGQWTVSGCFINASAVSNCSPSALHNVSPESRTMNVTIPPDLYITSVAAQDEAVNNTNVHIDVFVSNPLNDDRYGQTACIIENPAGANQTRSSPCSLITRQNSRTYNMSVFANVVGTWNIRNCTVSASSSSSCSGATATSSMINGAAFRVIRGYNLTISNLAITSPAYVSSQIFASYTLRNPSSTERFGRVTCTFTKGVQIVNRSACFTLPAESFIDSRANLTTEQAGAWTVACDAERSLDSSCSSLERHDSQSRSFDVVNPPDLYIQAIDMPALAPKDNLTVATLRIRNTALVKFYGFAGCTFKNRLNETLRNVSQCEELSGDTNNVAVGVIPELRGNWSVSGCFVNASRSEGCGGNRTHNVSTVSKSFSVTAPLLRIEQVYLTSANLVVGDIADITVDVKNIG
ncbi:MAG: hypothetical protein HY519_03625, partial [Candidatus Aenigmarchaeota archaeon]|nr:hypothetical protein [Candidatus Aenigmarchaeota archaeon]